MNRFLILISIFTLVFAFGCLENENKTAGDNGNDREETVVKKPVVEEPAVEAPDADPDKKDAEVKETEEPEKKPEEVEKPKESEKAKEPEKSVVAKKTEESKKEKDEKKAEEAKEDEKAQPDETSFNLLLSLSKSSFSGDCRISARITQNPDGQKFQGDFSDNRIRILQSNWRDKNMDFEFNSKDKEFYASKEASIKIDPNKKLLSDKIQAIVFEHKDIEDRSLSVEFKKGFLATDKNQKGKHKNVVSFDKDLTIRKKDAKGKMTAVNGLQSVYKNKTMLEFEGLEDFKGEEVTVSLSELHFGDYSGKKIKKDGFKIDPTRLPVSPEGKVSVDLSGIIEKIPSGKFSYGVLTMSRRFQLDDEWIPNNDGYKVKVYIEISDAIKVQLTK